MKDDERINAEILQPTTSKAGKSTELITMEQDVSCYETKVYCSKPGKPRVTNITSDSIEIEWTKSEQGAQNVTAYTVFYCSDSDPPDQWKKHTINNAKSEQQLRMTLSQLTEKNGIFLQS